MCGAQRSVGALAPKRSEAQQAQLMRARAYIEKAFLHPLRNPGAGLVKAFLHPLRDFRNFRLFTDFSELLDSLKTVK